MNTCLAFLQTALIFILITNGAFFNEVESGHKMLSSFDWFASSEKAAMQDVEGKEIALADVTEQKFPKPHHKKSKKRKIAKLKFLKKGMDWVVDETTEAVKKTKRKHKRVNKRVHKPVQRETRAYNITSESDEHEKGRKPVDIIVHIKMNEK